MRSRTHFIVGCASSVALIRPVTMSELGICMTFGILGGMISDLDVRTSDTHKLIDTLIFIVFTLLLGGYFIDNYLDIGIYKRILSGDSFTNILGLFFFIIVCFYGMHKPHRSFLHSFLCLFILGGILYICYDKIYLPFCIGFISHLCLDIFNKRGLKLLYPYKKGYSLKLCGYDGLADTIVFIVGIIILVLLLCIYPNF